MKTLYFDCFSGASGDMILGALIAAGVAPEQLKNELSKLGPSNYEINFETVNRSGISATYARVNTAPEDKHRHLSDILKIIYDSHLSESIKHRAATIFSRLAEAEARVHNQPINKIHFHEVGALDAIVDVVGAAICFDLLEIEQFAASPLNVGSGTVNMAHGSFPVPAPAVTELLKGIPFYSTEIQGELLTPTGAAIITTVCDHFGPLPQMKLQETGYGAGTREYEKFPNVLRVLIGETETVKETGETLWMLETNVDDMSPQLFGHVMDRAFQLGALDCYFTPIQMKKNRPGVLLSVLCRRADLEQLTDLLFSETTTLGVRSYVVNRRALQRDTIRVETEYGPIDVKVAKMNGHIAKEMPEYEQCRRAAIAANVALRVVEDAARRAFIKQSHNEPGR